VSKSKPLWSLQRKTIPPNFTPHRGWDQLDSPSPCHWHHSPGHDPHNGPCPQTSPEIGPAHLANSLAPLVPVGMAPRTMEASMCPPGQLPEVSSSSLHCVSHVLSSHTTLHVTSSHTMHDIFDNRLNSGERRNMS
jgi:hypothetical protein